ncbi:MAG TPA: hypothetical protein VGD67_10290 [Pseudonocardiaceae bacterium]
MTGKLLSRHLTSDGEVRYVACPCGAIHVLVNGRLIGGTHRH